MTEGFNILLVLIHIEGCIQHIRTCRVIRAVWVHHRQTRGLVIALALASEDQLATIVCGACIA